MKKIFDFIADDAVLLFLWSALVGAIVTLLVVVVRNVLGIFPV